jgi:subtilisin family serine protease
MRNIVVMPLVLYLSLFTSIVMVSALNQANAEVGPVRVLSGQYIVTRKSTTSSQLAGSDKSYITEKSSGYFDVVIPKSVVTKLAVKSERTETLNWAKVNQDCAEIKQDPTIDICEPDVIVTLAAVPNDSYFANQWALDDPKNDADIDAPPAWDRGTGTKSTLVGVIDSGIHSQHPDLAPNLWSNPDEAVDGLDNDGNGYVDDIFGINPIDGSNDPSDCQGHGTHVAGIIGAKGNNGLGVTGINWTIGLIVAKVGSDCGGNLSMSGILSAYNYFYDLKVRGHNVRLLNASYGSTVFSEASYQAIERLDQVGILLVAAAGNNNQNTSINPFYPAAYGLPNVISVAATGPDLKLASYSNYGTEVHIAAPGGQGANWYDAIMSTYSPLASNGGLYASLQGTSMAAPVVSGALALIASHDPSLTGPELKDIMIRSAYTVSGLEGLVDGSRFLNLKGMAELAAGDECPDDPNKLGPGLCGCGVTDTDSDGDGTPDCRDSCSSDKTKTSPGVCGCGVSDSDSDSDGVPDCSDSCATDVSKTSPGVCGCGIADTDVNGNGKIDCLDVGIGSIIPPNPVLRVKSGILYVSMTPLNGVLYYLQVTVVPPRRSRKAPVTAYYEMPSSKVRIRKIPRGTLVQVRYAYSEKGAVKSFSYWSYFARKTMN